MGLFTGGSVNPGDGTASGVAIGFGSGTGFIESLQTAIAWQPLTINGNYLAFQNSQTEAMRITGGNVGIGTTTPAAALDIKGRLRIENLSAGDASSVIEMKNNAGNLGYFYMNNSGDLVWQSPSTNPVFQMKDNGNIGIGTSTPYSKLTI